MLTLVAVLSSVAVSIIYNPHQASAKVCASNNNNNNNYANDITTCANQLKSNTHDHSIVKSSTPFLLAVPFP